ncbi:hypothetical protein N0V93_001811 [Gnomoniopsis smithogilvyi]|uniref:Heterokaryon incompatibility domain-containing protein n=1 Tax=Gnomoniopsis smithogilvyi TaxID=1191159 RepID=A0A9W9D2J5_9PEZI|nr:hypothetical protein N0V93_001811 [Gnomoniopsis smithogilvyi]
MRPSKSSTSTQPVIPSPNATTRSTETTELIRSWIQACKGHTLCQYRRSKGSSPFYPTRLISLPPENSDRIHLVTGAQLRAEQLSAGSTTGVEYVALSHCWGPPAIASKILQLRKNNFEDLRGSIPFFELPATFQHAIQATLDLGFRYLWIDSLCIIQDDDEDFAREAPTMGFLYANAVCTISATASENPLMGLWGSTDLVGDCVIGADYKITGGLMSFAVIRPPILPEWESLDKDFEVEVEAAPATQRGWIFQESILSKCVLHYVNGLILFECNTMRASNLQPTGIQHRQNPNFTADGNLESFVGSRRLASGLPMITPLATAHIGRSGGGQSSRGTSTYPPLHGVSTMNNVTQQAKEENLQSLSALTGMRGSFQLVMRSTGQTPAEKMEFHQRWYEMIEQYSSRQLTHDTDRMMAISGVAEFIQSRTLPGRTFWAGLWSDCIIYNLLWLRAPENDLKDRPARVVSTWSWVSVDGKVTHRLKEATSTTGADEGKIKPKYRAPMSFQSNWDELSPLIQDVSVTVIRNPTEPDVHDGIIHNARLELSCWELVDLDTIPTEGLFKSFDVQSSMEETLYLLPVLSFINPKVKPVDSSTQVDGLILRQLSIESDTFERVGYFWAFDEDITDRFLKRQEVPTSIFIV